VLRAIVLVSLVLCVAVPASPDPQPSSWHYGVRYDQASGTIFVAVTGANAPREWILPDDRGATLTEGSVLRHRTTVDGLVQRGGGTEDSERVGRDFVTRPPLIFPRPRIWPDDAKVTATFRLPKGYRVAVAWQPLDETHYALKRGALGPQTRIAIGRWVDESFRFGETLVDVAVLDGAHRTTPAGRRRWLTRAMGTVAQLYDGFPAERLQVIAQPRTPDRGRPIVFGRASRGGGALVHVMMSGTKGDDAFPGEYLTIHELTHLGMPWHEQASQWWGEGVVCYYQEVLRARAGILTEQQAWQLLHSWFERGRRSGGKQSLLIESERMTTRYAYHRVYYGGAALTLLMDLEVRRHVPGKTFDDVVRFWHRTYGAVPKANDAMVLLRAADTWLGAKVLVPLVSPYLGSTKFPDLRRAYSDLGIVVRDGRVALDDGAPRARDRRAIMGLP